MGFIWYWDHNPGLDELADIYNDAYDSQQRAQAGSSKRVYVNNYKSYSENKDTAPELPTVPKCPHADKSDGDNATKQATSKQPEGPKRRNLVVCIDGTANKFGEKNSNVVQFFSRLRKDSDQLTYYDSGIGTCVKSSQGWKSYLLYSTWKQRCLQGLDMAIAWNFKAKIFAAYQWLSENYQNGDRIFLLGFSRGAYQVRVIAGMCELVGILHKGNNGQIPFAYDLYIKSLAKQRSTTGRSKVKGNRRLCHDFKKNLSRDVTVHFVGAWDTVSSIGIFRGRSLPETTDGMQHVCAFRHALALDEHRVKFLPEYANGGDGPRKQSPRVKEVWFLGSHSDVGGGNTNYNPSLRWMTQEAMAWGLRMTATPNTAIPTIDPPDNTVSFFWKVLEYLPLLVPRLSYTGKDNKEFVRPHRLRGRVIQQNQNVHASVFSAAQTGYKPGALVFGHRDSNIEDLRGREEPDLSLETQNFLNRIGGDRHSIDEKGFAALDLITSSASGRTLLAANAAGGEALLTRLKFECADKANYAHSTDDDLKHFNILVKAIQAYGLALVSTKILVVDGLEDIQFSLPNNPNNPMVQKIRALSSRIKSKTPDVYNRPELNSYGFEPRLMLKSEDRFNTMRVEDFGTISSTATQINGQKVLALVISGTSGPEESGKELGLQEHYTARAEAVAEFLQGTHQVEITSRAEKQAAVDNLIRLAGEHATAINILCALERIESDTAVARNTPIVIYYTGACTISETLEEWDSCKFFRAQGEDQACIRRLDVRPNDSLPFPVLSAALIKLARAKGENITVILDCPSAGSDSSRADEMIARIPHGYVSGVSYLPPYVLLASTASKQAAAASGRELDGESFTDAILSVLRRCREGHLALTYRDVISCLPMFQHDGQAPQCIGGFDSRFLFSLSAPSPARRLYPARISLDGRLVVEAGAVHGIAMGNDTKFKIFTSRDAPLHEISTIMMRVIALTSVSRKSSARKISARNLHHHFWAEEIEDLGQKLRSIDLAVTGSTEACNLNQSLSVTIGGQGKLVFSWPRTTPLECRLQREITADCQSNDSVHDHGSHFFWHLLRRSPVTDLKLSLVSVRAFDLHFSTKPLESYPTLSISRLEKLSGIPFDIPNRVISISKARKHPVLKLRSTRNMAFYVWAFGFRMDNLAVEILHKPVFSKGLWRAPPCLPQRYSELVINLGAPVTEETAEGEVTYVKIFITSEYVDLSHIESPSLSDVVSKSRSSASSSRAPEKSAPTAERASTALVASGGSSRGRSTLRHVKRELETFEEGDGDVKGTGASAGTRARAEAEAEISRPYFWDCLTVTVVRNKLA